MYVYEWVPIVRAQVYEWGGFWNVGPHVRTKMTPSYPPSKMYKCILFNVGSRRKPESLFPAEPTAGVFTSGW